MFTLPSRSTPSALLLAASLALSVGSGCAQQQSATSPNARAAAVKVDQDAYATLGYRLEWRGYPVMTQGGTVRFMEVLGDVVACQESSSTITLLDARSGIPRCNDQLGNPLNKFVGIVRDGNRIVSSSETDAYFLSADTCTLVDRHSLGKVVTTKPALASGALVYGTASGEILGHLAASPVNLWGNSLPGDIIADPVTSGNLVAFVSQGGEVVIIDASNGSSIGRAHLEGGVAPNDRFGGPLAISPTALFVASLDQSVYAFDLRNCHRMWRIRTDTPLRTHPVYHDGTLYCDLPSQGLTAFEPGTGNQRWVARGISGTPLAMRKGRLIVWNDRSSTAYALDPATGQTIEQVKLTDIGFLKTDAFKDGNLYTASPNGVIAKFVPRT